MILLIKTIYISYNNKNDVKSDSFGEYNEESNEKDTNLK